MKTGLYILTLVCVTSNWLSAQILEKEVIFDLDKKEARTAAINGYPNDILVDDAKRQFELVYITKAKPKSLTKNHVVFDYDLNHVETITKEIELVKSSGNAEPVEELAKSHPNYRGDQLVQTSLQYTVAITGATRLEKTEVTHTYNWTKAQYESETKVLEEVKAKNLFGKIIYNPYAFHFNDPANGDLIYASEIVPKTLGREGILLRRVTPDLEMTEIGKIDFKYFQRQFYGGWVKNEKGGSDLIMIYAAAGGKGVYKPKQNQSPNVNEWTYVRIGSDGTVKNRASFQTKVNNWNILGSVYSNGSVFVYGPGETKDVNSKHQDLISIIGTGKQDAFQILKVTGDKVDFVSGPALEEMNAKAAKPESQKKFIEYDGRKVDFRNFSFSSNGDIFISAQDYSTDARTTLPLYKDLFMFHFAADGTFKRLYGINSVKEKAGLGGAIDQNTDPRFYPDQGEVFQGSDGTMYWNIYGVQRIDKYSRTWVSYNTEYTETNWIPRLTGAIAKFDVASGQVEEFKKLGNGDFTLYNIPSIGTPSVAIENGTKRVYIGNGGEKGRQIWLGKIDPATL